MTHSIPVTQAVVGVIQPGRDYTMDEIRHLLHGRGISSAQLRNALCGLSQSRRLLKFGPHTHGRYRLNTNPPKARAGAAASPHAKHVIGTGYGRAKVATGSPDWAAPGQCQRLDRNPTWRIAA